MENIHLIIITFLISVVILVPVGYFVRKKIAESKIQGAEYEAKKLIENANKEIANMKKENILIVKEENLRLKNELDQEIKERRSEIQQQERRIIQKEENLEKRTETFEKKEKELEKQLGETTKKQELLDKTLKEQEDELHKISKLSEHEAKTIILSRLENKLKEEKAAMIKTVEAETKEQSHRLATEIVGFAIQKCAADHTSETTVSVV